MSGQQPLEVSDKKSTDVSISIKIDELWTEAARAFESICGESLQRGDVKTFDDVLSKIGSGSKTSYGFDAEPESKWDKTKSVALESLKYLKFLVGAAAQVSSVFPVPSSAVDITSSALFLAFDVQEAIERYNDAVDQVFEEVSSVLAQFRIYESMDNVPPSLIDPLIDCIRAIIVSFVKLCAHVVRYRQGRKRDRFKRQFKSVFDDDSGLADEMTNFKRALQQQHHLDGTMTLAVVFDMRQVLAETHQGVQETHEVVVEMHQGVQSLNAEHDRRKALYKICDVLDVPPKTVYLDSKTTPTCTSISNHCLDGTGPWLWTHDAYTAWTAPKDKGASHVLLISGPRSSGKTSATSLVAKRLEDQDGRIYVAHHFFPTITKKSPEDDKNPVQSALKYMAFQIARVDATVLKALGNACTAPGAFRTVTDLDNLWGELKIGAPKSGATYYLLFDGLENLPDGDAKMLLQFVFGPQLAREAGGRVRVLLSGTDDVFNKEPAASNALRIKMNEHNMSDMRIIIEDRLNRQGMLTNAKLDSEQREARVKIVEKLPEKVEGSYYKLNVELNEVIRLFRGRPSYEELDQMLNQSTMSHKEAIENLQRSLTGNEISVLNELLEWVLFSMYPLNLDELEAAMFLNSRKKSPTTLDFIIKDKYLDVLKLDGTYVHGQDGIKDHLLKGNSNLDRSTQSKDRATISMTITINNADQETCAHFLWDLAHKAIWDKFDFGTASNLLHSSKISIAVDEFKAHHSMVKRAFEYLSEEYIDQAKGIGVYLVSALPYHLGHLRRLEDEDKGELMNSEKLEIGQKLYSLFKDDRLLRRHKASFEQIWWTAAEIEDVRIWLTDFTVVRRLDKSWREEVQIAASPTKGFLRELVKLVVEGFLKERSWGLRNSYYWIWEFMDADEQKQRSPAAPNTVASDAVLSVSSGNEASATYWDRVSTWCQRFLGLSDSELNSLWYERLAATASLLEQDADVVSLLYQRALEKENPSWLCYRGLGETYYEKERTPDTIKQAIEQVELALRKAEGEGATPKPEDKDIIELYLLLAEYSYEAGHVQKAAEHYLRAYKSEITEKSTQGWLGYLKSMMNFANIEASRDLLKTTLTRGDEGSGMVSILKCCARDTGHDVIISKMFTIAKGDSDLMKEMVRAMERATSISTLGENDTAGLAADERFAEDESRGVLLYHRGVAVYKYNMSPCGTEPVSDAQKLWIEAREVLSNIGGYNAYIVMDNAATALAKHYFQSMVDDERVDCFDALAKLAEANTDVFYGDSLGFLGALYALRSDKEQSKKVLEPRIKLGLQILVDDIPDNDSMGLYAIHKALGQHRDFKNAAIALSLLGQPDLVTESLQFEAKDILADDHNVDGERVLHMVKELAIETAHVVKTKFPNASQQTQRIETAKAHSDALVAAVEAKVKSEVNMDGENANAEGTGEGESAITDLNTAAAHRLLHARLSDLQQRHTPKLVITGFMGGTTCDGLTPEGKGCRNTVGFDREFYHCIYCANKDFCGDCLERLRDPKSAVEITACSRSHKWLRVPPLGHDMYVGPEATSIRMPNDARWDDTGSILEICYPENGGEEITVEAWMDTVASDWGMSLSEIREMARQATPESDESGKEK